MKEKNVDKLAALRSVKSAILLELTKDGKTNMSDEIAIQIISKLVKQRKESASIFRSKNRLDLEKEELSQILETSIPDRNKIITYYNIFYILKNILLPIDTIIYDKFVDSISKKLEYKYVRIKSIECTKQLPSIKILTGSNINVYFKIKFEEIPIKSILRFNLHIKDENYILSKTSKRY